MKTTLDELLALTTVVDSGSITAAAEHLGQTASGVSRALSRLEEKLDVTLLQRTTRRLELTEEGRAFVQQARRIVASVEDAEEQMALRRQRPAGRLRVNAASPFMLHVIVPLVPGFRALYPDIELELHSSDQIIDLIEQRTDVAIRIGPLRDSTLHARPLGSNRLRVLASPGYVQQFGAPDSVEALSERSLLGFTQPDSLNQWPLRHALGQHWQVTPSIKASSGETLRQLALEGAGIVCLADFMTLQDRLDGRLVQVLEAQTVDVLQPIHAVYYRNTALASRITCFLDYVSAQMKA
ncbi:LysR substrate-binding domain-containing protein [Pseudomonas sp. GV071]|jgi:DNA-binding transcriptional LysR family regulator|uniref:LysR substrate-binding domain-containing protein n=1 Tax=Pseudomonas sp. GV071 TaxID=2135754 RepID=UPI000D3866F1|nr:LysR substrate-binding domain-containing protein [Pseudomonas sp. GV071]PTQ72987.1 LysR family transcriptional regulator [Pseudomonas sp. GV071]